MKLFDLYFPHPRSTMVYRMSTGFRLCLMSWPLWEPPVNPACCYRLPYREVQFVALRVDSIFIFIGSGDLEEEIGGNCISFHTCNRSIKTHPWSISLWIKPLENNHPSTRRTHATTVVQPKKKGWRSDISMCQNNQPTTFRFHGLPCKFLIISASCYPPAFTPAQITPPKNASPLHWHPWSIRTQRDVSPTPRTTPTTRSGQSHWPQRPGRCRSKDGRRAGRGETKQTWKFCKLQLCASISSEVNPVQNKAWIESKHIETNYIFLSNNVPFPSKKAKEPTMAASRTSYSMYHHIRSYLHSIVFAKSIFKVSWSLEMSNLVVVLAWHHPMSLYDSYEHRCTQYVHNFSPPIDPVGFGQGIL